MAVCFENIVLTDVDDLPIDGGWEDDALESPTSLCAALERTPVMHDLQFLSTIHDLLAAENATFVWHFVVEPTAGGDERMIQLHWLDLRSGTWFPREFNLSMRAECGGLKIVLSRPTLSISFTAPRYPDAQSWTPISVWDERSAFDDMCAVVVESASEGSLDALAVWVGSPRLKAADNGA